MEWRAEECAETDSLAEGDTCTVGWFFRSSHLFFHGHVTFCHTSWTLIRLSDLFKKSQPNPLVASCDSPDPHEFTSSALVRDTTNPCVHTLMALSPGRSPALSLWIQLVLACAWIALIDLGNLVVRLVLSAASLGSFLRGLVVQWGLFA